MATATVDRASEFLGGLFTSLTLRGRNLFRSGGSPPMTGDELIELGEALLSRRGEASGRRGPVRYALQHCPIGRNPGTGNPQRHQGRPR